MYHIWYLNCLLPGGDALKTCFMEWHIFPSLQRCLYILHGNDVLGLLEDGILVSRGTRGTENTRGGARCHGIVSQQLL